jgi:prepilin-type N-terminal cleavage/methylation domain-containing protein
MKRSARNHGFSLMELIVVIGVLAVPATIGTLMLNRITDTWRAESTRTELDSRAQYVFSQMRQDFSEAVSAKLSGAAIKGLVQTAQDKRYHRVPLEDDRFFIPATLAAADGTPQRADVGYYINRENSQCRLMRAVRVPGAANPIGQAVAEGVLAMRVEYAGAQGWQAGWSSGVNPQAVRVSLVLMDPDMPWQQVARKAVFSVHVN